MMLKRVLASLLLGAMLLNETPVTLFASEQETVEVQEIATEQENVVAQEVAVEQENVVAQEVAAEQEVVIAEEYSADSAIVGGSNFIGEEEKENVDPSDVYVGYYVPATGGEDAALATPTYGDHVYTQLVSRIQNAVQTGQTTINVSDLGLVRNAADTKTYIFSALEVVISTDYRYFYYNANRYGYTYSSSTNTLNSLIIRYLDEYKLEDGSLNVALVNEDRVRWDNAMGTALSEVKPGMNDVEKALTLYNYIIRACDYDYDDYRADTIPDISYTAKGVLMEGVAVCQGYAEAYAMLLKEVGITSYLTASDRMNHAWNVVYLNGNWYHADATWDDPISGSSMVDNYSNEGKVGHTYFLKSDAEFENLEHYAWDTTTPVAGRSGTFDNYCFFNVDEDFYYYNGYWYYLSPNYYDVLMKARIDNRSAAVEIPLSNNAYSAHGYDGRIIYATKEMLWVYDIDTGLEGRYKEFVTSYPNTQITEFGLKNQQFIVVLWNSYTGNLTRLYLSSDTKSVSSVLVDRSGATFTAVGQTMQLGATVFPGSAYDQRVTWRSADPSVASVDSNGVVTAVGKGITGIIVTTLSGNKSDLCIVTVDIPESGNGNNGQMSEQERNVRSFVERMYTVVLGRSADENGLSDWADGLMEWRVDGAAVANGFVNSAEFAARGLSNEQYIEVLYRAILNREADTAGKADWLRAFAQGATRQDLLNGFVTSAEFDALCDSYGILAVITQEDRVRTFAERMYTVALNRPADENGLNDWVCGLVSGTVDGAAIGNGFINSPEFVARNLSDSAYIDVLYRTFLDRNADVAGMRSWLLAFLQGATRQDLLNGVITSAEFAALCDGYGIKAVLTQEDLVRSFVKRMYTVALNREADENGLNSWATGLMNGVVKGAEVAEGFIMSSEFAARNLGNDAYIRTLYLTLFNREPGASEIAGWVNALVNVGHSRRDVLRGFVNSDEFGTLCQNYGIIRGTMY